MPAGAKCGYDDCFLDVYLVCAAAAGVGALLCVAISARARGTYAALAAQLSSGQ